MRFTMFHDSSVALHASMQLYLLHSPQHVTSSAFPLPQANSFPRSERGDNAIITYMAEWIPTHYRSLYGRGLTDDMDMILLDGEKARYGDLCNRVPGFFRTLPSMKNILPQILG